MSGWHVVFWHWWAFGALLLVIELLGACRTFDQKAQLG